MSRASLFTGLPASRAIALGKLRALRAAGLDWHLDDSPETIVNAGVVRVFTDDECVYLRALVARLNELWPADGTINGGGWAAVSEAGWLGDGA